MPDQPALSRHSWLHTFDHLILDLKGACISLGSCPHPSAELEHYNQQAVDAQQWLSRHVRLLLDALPDTPQGSPDP